MPKTLSMDMRERIVRDVSEGRSRRSAAEKFAVLANSAVRIVARHLATGSVAPKAGRGGRRSQLDEHRDIVLATTKKEPLEGGSKEFYREASNRVGKSHSRPSLDVTI